MPNGKYTLEDDFAEVRRPFTVHISKHCKKVGSMRLLDQIINTMLPALKFQIEREQKEADEAKEP